MAERRKAEKDQINLSIAKKSGQKTVRAFLALWYNLNVKMNDKSEFDELVISSNF